MVKGPEVYINDHLQKAGLPSIQCVSSIPILIKTMDTNEVIQNTAPRCSLSYTTYL